MDSRWRLRPVGATLCALLLAAAAPTAGEPTLRLDACAGRTCLVARLPEGLAADLAGRAISESLWREALPVRTETAAASEPPGPTIFGEYSFEGGELTFRPRLPFLPGTGYVAVLRPAVLRRLAESPGAPEASREIELRFRPATPRREAPRVTAIHPGSGTVPANLLRAYVHFSAPMRPDVAGGHVKLLDEAGRPVELPFVEIDGGLWDQNHTRLTLLFHPGRIKRGVAPREALGPPLEEDRGYRLVVEPGWPAATGELLELGSETSWRTGEADRGLVDPARWMVVPPSAGTSEPLRVDFGEALDHALALRLIGVRRDGTPVAGEAELGPGGSQWSFRPSEPWAAAEHELTVHPALEDLAGNNLRGPFDREPGEEETAAPAATVRFRPR